MTQPRSDHYDGRRFFNPSGLPVQPFTAVPRMLLERRAPWPSRVDQPQRRPPDLDGAAALVTPIGHATFLIQTAEGNILTDPMYSERASPLNVIGPRRVRHVPQGRRDVVVDGRADFRRAGLAARRGERRKHWAATARSKENRGH